VQAAVVIFGCVLVGCSAALAVADFSDIHAEQPWGIRLGRLGLLDDSRAVEKTRARLDTIGYGSAAKAFGPALERNAASAYRWCDVGEVLLDAGDQRLAEYCYLRAGELAPNDPRILLDIGDFYTTIRNPRAALTRFATILSLTGAPSGDILTHNVFTYYERLHIRQNGLLGQAIPDAANARAYLRYLTEDTDTAAVSEAWTWVRHRGFDDDGLALDYVSYMLRNKRTEAASAGWAAHFAERGDGYPQLTPVFNGGFEYELTGGALDWRFEGFNGVKVERDANISYEGHFSLRTEFSANDNPDFHHLRQLLTVRPGLYRFEAQIKTSRITSDQGIGFSVRGDSGSKSWSVDTGALTGTNEWKRLDLDVEVPAGTRTVEIALQRRRSARIDNQLTGTAWIDAVRLTRVR
jgi:tetratricopeptide (TPR) repeat protein